MMIMTAGLWSLQDDSITSSALERKDNETVNPVTKKVVLIDELGASSKKDNTKRNYTIAWCASSTAYSLAAKSLLNTYDHPIIVAITLLLSASLYTLYTWVIKQRRVPSIKKFRSRHWKNLALGSFYHGAGTALAVYSILSGPVSSSILLQMVQPSSFTLASATGVTGSLLSVSSATQLLYSISSSIFFFARGRVPLSSHRFQGSQNLFGVICMIGVVILASIAPIFGETLSSLPSFMEFGLMLIMGISYVVCNEIAFQISHEKQSDVIRRTCAWSVSTFVFNELHVGALVGAVLVILGFAFGDRSSNISRGRTSSESTVDSGYPSIHSYTSQRAQNQ